MTEKDIQNRLFVWLEKKGQSFITPNVNLFSYYESDLISVSKAGLISEYEIKISADDFRREFKDKRTKHRMLNDGKGFARIIPNYFYFVFPLGLYESRQLEIPDYAGVIAVSESGKVITKKRCRRLHGVSITDRKLAYLGRGLMYRYWSARTRGEGNSSSLERA